MDSQKPASFLEAMTRLENSRNGSVSLEQRLIILVGSKVSELFLTKRSSGQGGLEAKKSKARSISTLIQARVGWLRLFLMIIETD